MKHRYLVEIWEPGTSLPAVVRFIKARSKKAADRKARRQQRHFYGRQLGVAVYVYKENKNEQ